MLCLGLGLLMPLSVPASSENDAAGTEEISWVFDDYGLLDETEQAQLDQELGDIYEEYGYDAVLLISPDIGEDQDYRKYAAEFMQENDIGYGDTYEGMCIFHQPDARNITIVFRGDTQDDFPSNVQEEMLDKCKEYLKADDPVRGYQRRFFCGNICSRSAAMFPGDGDPNGIYDLDADAQDEDKNAAGKCKCLYCRWRFGT